MKFDFPAVRAMFTPWAGERKSRTDGMPAMTTLARRAVLVVEDEDDAAQAVLDVVVGRHGWETFRARTVEEACAVLRTQPIAIVILDRILAGSRDGLELLQRCRTSGTNVAVMVLSSLGTTRHLVTGFDAGADDYVIKPFDPDELAARLQALARRLGYLGGFGDIVQIGALELRRALRHASWRGEALDLGDQGFAILQVLSDRIGETVSRDMLWREVWPHMVRLGPQAHVIEQAVSRVRKAFRTVGAPDPIRSHRGQGYRMDV